MTWPRVAVPSDDGEELSQTVLAGLADLAWGRLRDARFAADGMFDACNLLQYTLNTFSVHRLQNPRQNTQCL